MASKLYYNIHRNGEVGLKQFNQEGASNIIKWLGPGMILKQLVITIDNDGNATEIALKGVEND